MLGLLLGLLLAQESSIAAVPTATPTPSLIDQYRQDYSFQVAEYQKKYIDYIDKKEVYTKYRTITSEKDKTDAAKNALIARNTMLKSYLLALRVSLDTFKTSSATTTEKIQIELSRWEDWCQEQNLIIINLNSQDDINNWVNDFKTKYIPIQTVIYTALTQNQINQRLLSLQLITKLAEKLKLDPKTGNLLNDYLSSLPVKSDLVSARLKNAFDLTQTKQLSNRFVNFYSDAKTELYAADRYLQNMLSDLKAVAIKLNQ
jgi:hypothetical protein